MLVQEFRIFIVFFVISETVHLYNTTIFLGVKHKIYNLRNYPVDKKAEVRGKWADWFQMLKKATVAKEQIITRCNRGMRRTAHPAPKLMVQRQHKNRIEVCSWGQKTDASQIISNWFLEHEKWFAELLWPPHGHHFCIRSIIFRDVMKWKICRKNYVMFCQYKPKSRRNIWHRVDLRFRRSNFVSIRRQC